MKENIVRELGLSAGLLLAFMFLPAVANSHCDTMDGPVVTAAKRALETNNVNLVLIWVRKSDEQIIREAFAKTMAVRSLNGEARALADMYFFETLVRLHRAGEGVGYAGLKPTGTPVDPGIESADNALKTGKVDEIVRYLSVAVNRHIRGKFSDALAKQNYAIDSLEAGREYVKAYVEFIHYVERLHQAVALPAEGHVHEAEAGELH